MDCSVLLTQAFILRWKRVCIAHNNYMSCPSIWATLSALLINILLGSFQLFLHSDRHYLGWNNPDSAVSADRGGCIIHARRHGSFTHWLTNCFDVQPTTTSGNIMRRASFSALTSANSFVYFASGTVTSRWRICMSVIAAFASFKFSGILATGFVGNGVITVMINSPWQADDDADNRPEIIAVTLLIHQSLWPFRPSLNFAIRLSALCSNWPHNQRQQWSRIMLAVRLPDRYHQNQS